MMPHFRRGIALLGLTILFAIGCRRHEEPQAVASAAAPPAASNSGDPSSVASAVRTDLVAPTTSARATASSSARPSPTTAPTRVSGRSLRFLPDECPEGRIFLDVAGILTAAGKERQSVIDGVSRALAGGGEGRPVAAALAAEGLDLGRDVHELALCARGGDDVVLAVDLALGSVRGDLYDLIVRAAGERGRKLVRGRTQGLDTLAVAGERGVLARVGTSTLVAARTVETVLAVASGNGRGPAVPPRTLLSIDLAPRPDQRMTATLREVDGAFVLAAAMPLPAGQRGGSSARTLLSQLVAARDSAAQRLETSSLRTAAAELRRVELRVEGEGLRASTTLTRPRFAALLGALGSARAEDLAALAPGP